MGLTTEQWTRINDATKMLRDMGCAVCVFTVDDLEGAAAEENVAITSDQADTWMTDNRKWLEAGMAQQGNQTIAEAVSDQPWTSKGEI